MARLELARRLEELNMSAGEAKEYGALFAAVEGHIAQLHDLLESRYLTIIVTRRGSRVVGLDLAAREEERVWMKRQTDGELDDSRLTEGLTGEATVYKRRGMEKPEMGRPQIKCVLPISQAKRPLTAYVPAAGPKGSAFYSTSARQCG